MVCWEILLLFFNANFDAKLKKKKHPLYLFIILIIIYHAFIPNYLDYFLLSPFVQLPYELIHHLLSLFCL
jgi:hypothetical protein